MKLSVVIPAFNEEKLLPDCLQSVAHAAAVFGKRGWEHEVIVCDNNSTDRTAEIAAHYGARVVFEEINQIGRARNAGASVARGEWLLFVDADSRVSWRLFESLTEAIGSGCVVGGGACLLPSGEFSAAFWLPLMIWNRISRTLRWAAGSFLFCRRDLFGELGGFSLERYAGEELDLSQRIKGRARDLGKGFVILDRGWLETSSRKVGLYSSRELMMTFFRCLISYRSTTGDRNSCFLWYDGRR